MNNPRTVAIISGIAAIMTGYSIFFSNEAPGQMLSILQWFIFICALVGCVGSLIQLARK